MKTIPKRRRRQHQSIALHSLRSSESSPRRLPHRREARGTFRQGGLLVPKFNISPRVRQHTLRNDISLCYDPRRIASTPLPIVVKQKIDIMLAMLDQSVRQMKVDESVEADDA
jgi:hypothetical protein